MHLFAPDQFLSGHFPEEVEINVEVAPPVLPDAPPGGRRVAGAGDPVEDACDGAAGQRVLFYVGADEGSDVGADLALILASHLHGNTIYTINI